MEILNGDAQLRELSLEFFAIKFEYSRTFLAQIAPFFSLVSATLLSFQEATSNEIKDLRGGSLQVEIGGR